MLNIGKRIALAYVEVDDHPLSQHRQLRAVLPVAKVENNVAVLYKSRPRLESGCGARHSVRVEAPFYVRGGFRVFPVELWKVKPESLGLNYYRQRGSTYDRGTWSFPAGRMYLTDEEKRKLIEDEKRKMEEKSFEIQGVEDKTRKITVYIRHFKVGKYIYDPEEPWADVLPPIAVYEIVSENEAKFVDVDAADYVALFLSHSVHSRSFTARLVFDNAVHVDEKRTACAIDSVVVALAWFKVGARAIINRNLPPYRGENQKWAAEVWTMSLPPQLEKVLYVDEPLLETSSTVSPEEVV